MRYPPIKKGQVFERLTVLSRAEKQGGMRMWLCQCSCGVERAIRDAHLKKGITKSCGCLSRDVQVGKAKERAGSVIGRKINQWDVLSLSPRRAKQGGVYFNCRCVCGQEREVAGDGLLAGRSKSCGSCGVHQKPICKLGHVVAEWGGRTPSGTCKACLKHKSLLRNYGWTLAEVVALWHYQDHKCAVCGEPLELIPKGGPGWSVGVRSELDHEHTADLPLRATVRGLLCGGRWKGCNRKLGHIDDIPWLEKVVDYLKNPPARKLLAEEKK